MTLQQLLRSADTSLDETVALLSDLVRIASVNGGPEGPGNESEVARLLAAKLAADGVASQLLEARPNRGNLVARLDGGSAPSLLYMGHTDVVPAEDAELWRYPPFAGTVAEGYVHGRGAADCKALVACETMALLILARQHVPLAGSLILAAGADEETGGQHGFAWLARHHPEAIRADCAINEGGGSPFFVGGRKGYLINTGEKGRLEASLRLDGKGGHAATPWAADNPIERLPELLIGLRRHQIVPDLSHPIFEVTSEVFQSSLTRLLQVDFGDLSRSERGLVSALRGASRMTITPTMLLGGVKSNSIPASCSVVCDVRTLPGQTAADVMAEIRAALGKVESVQIELQETAEPSESPYPTPFSQAIERATAAASEQPDLLWIPGLTSGFSDSRLVRPLGTTVYGFAPQSADPDALTPEGIHGRDECMPIESLRVTLRMLVALAWEMLVAH